MNSIRPRSLTERYISGRMKAGGTIANLAACSISASGTVVIFAANIKGCGFNFTGSSLSSGDYFWMQVSGEVGGLDTNTGMTAVGYPVGVTESDGTTLADPTTGIIALANTTVAVKDATAGIINLSGLY